MRQLIWGIDKGSDEITEWVLRMDFRLSPGRASMEQNNTIIPTTHRLSSKARKTCFRLPAGLKAVLFKVSSLYDTSYLMSITKIRQLIYSNWLLIHLFSSVGYNMIKAIIRRYSMAFMGGLIGGILSIIVGIIIIIWPRIIAYIIGIYLVIIGVNAIITALR